MEYMNFRWCSKTQGLSNIFLFRIKNTMWLEFIIILSVISRNVFQMFPDVIPHTYEVIKILSLKMGRLASWKET